MQFLLIAWLFLLVSCSPAGPTDEQVINDAKSRLVYFCWGGNTRFDKVVVLGRKIEGKKATATVRVSGDSDSRFYSEACDEFRINKVVEFKLSYEQFDSGWK